MVAEPASLGQSIWLREVMGCEKGAPPSVDLVAERRTGEFVRALIASGAVSAVHDISDGGMLVAAAEMALAGGIGAHLPALQGMSDAAYFFGEAQARFLVTAAKNRNIGLEASRAGVTCLLVGDTGGDAMIIGRSRVSLLDLRRAHEGFFPSLMGADAALA
jgi:phosphoribosylformylglycinamidine synthase